MTPTPTRRWLLYALLGLAVPCLASCVPTVRALKHSPIAAAQEAQKFADAAFIERDYKNAHALLSQPMQKEYPLERFQAELAKMHPSGYPSKVHTTEFEPIPGQAAMSIFLVGENDSGKFYYRFVMMGTEDTGYEVGAFLRGSGPYPASQMRHSLQR